ncbi:unnamed protein product [Haemonchus placei]|uniref:Protein kinase domain-containing protein n=1 Tax=Haemonchus placei TaxID=6290 RepID=A0A0N4W256_HAEPC|nr:unnamed protein product [Haemonchus placei]
MGNVHSSSSSSDVLPVDDSVYWLKCAKGTIAVFSLGSTRFMKVARGRNSEGTCVWKVFLTQEDSSVYEPYRKELFRIRDALVNAPNCCTVKKIYTIERRIIQVTPKWAVLIRPFQKQTLCDRLSTRPFIVQQEKIWYIYQLFKAIAQCQKANVCHGDLKSQNVLLTSSNWLQITDFAPYKPTYLPHDNPSSFTFFFDTSRHQHCYLAPERFLSSVDYENIHKEKGDEWLFGSLQPSMDLFAVGCVVYELLHDSGKPPFSYGELCLYQRMSSSDAASFLERYLLVDRFPSSSPNFSSFPSPRGVLNVTLWCEEVAKTFQFLRIFRLLQDIAAQFRPLLKLLLNRDPSLRVSAQQVLDGSVLHFPKVLDAFFSYLNAFRPKEITTSQSLEGFEQSQMAFHLEPDDVIAKLKRDEKSIWERLTECEESRPYAILFISLITANIRVLRSVPAKIVSFSREISPVVSFPWLVRLNLKHNRPFIQDAMNMLVKLASLCGPVVSTERVLPYLVCCLSEVDAQVRASAVYSITELLRPIEPATFEDSLVFIDYLLPELASYIWIPSSMLSDKRHPCPTHVLLAVATNLGDIAETAYRFHVVGRNLRNGVADDEISGAENISGGEILLRHMITFLNVKSDWRLRAVFFESLPICVQKNSFDVKPLLQQVTLLELEPCRFTRLTLFLVQGLHDFEELVVIHAIHCIIVLVETGVLGRNEMLELLEDTLPFLSHPNEWIRVTVVELLIVLDSCWSLADVHCRLLPLVRPYLQDSSLLRLNNKLVVLTCLKSPIPRDVWKKVTEMSPEQTEALHLFLGKEWKF